MLTPVVPTVPSNFSFLHPIGEAFGAFKSAVYAVLGKVSSIAGLIFNPIGELPRDTGVNAGITRKIGKYILPVLQVAGQRFGWARAATFVSHLQASCCDVADIFELARVAVPINYFWNGVYKDERETDLGIAGQAVAAVADISAVPLALHDFDLIDLGRISESLGNIRYLSFLAAIPLATVSFIASTIAHGFFALNTFNKLRKAEQKAARTETQEDAATILRKMQKRGKYKGVTALGVAQLAEARKEIAHVRKEKIVAKKYELGGYISDLALDALLIAGVTSLSLLALAGSVCVAFNLASMIHQVK